VKTIDVNITDGVDPVTPTSVGLVGNTLTIEVPTSAPPSTGTFLVRFFDIDGTILKEERRNAGQAATAPSNPTFDSTYLTFFGWNQDFSNITHDLDVGAIYDTIDGKTYLFLRVTTITGLQPILQLNKSTTALLTIDWGDATTNTTTTSGNVNITKTAAYSSVGDYVVSIECADNYGVNNTGFLLGNNTTYSRTLIKAYLGLTFITIPNSAFNSHPNCNILSLSKNTLSTGFNAFQSCSSLICMNLPLNTTTINGTAFSGCSSLKYMTSAADIGGTNIFQNCRNIDKIIIRSGVVSIASQYAAGTTSCKKIIILAPLTSLNDSFSGTGVESIVLPNSITSITNNFVNCLFLKSVTIPNGLTTLGLQTFFGCSLLNDLDFPSTLTSIAANCFNGCTGAIQYTFRSTTPPTLAATSAFSGINSLCKIYVPDANVAAYQAATNWSTYANYIYPLSTKP
jgi:hypothetical protein